MNNDDKILKLLEIIVSDVGGLKSDVGELKSDVGGLKSDVGGLKSDVGELKQGQSRLENRIDKVELRLEHEAFNKIAALFDAWENTNDKLDQHSEQLNYLTNQVEHVAADAKLLVRRIVKLEKAK